MGGGAVLKFRISTLLLAGVQTIQPLKQLAERGRGKVGGEEVGLADVGRGGLLHHFLVAPLNGALPLPQGHDAPLPVPKDLDLYVPRPLHVLLHKYTGVSKARFALPAGLDVVEKALYGEFWIWSVRRGDCMILSQAHLLETEGGGGHSWVQVEGWGHSAVHPFLVPNHLPRHRERQLAPLETP